MQSAQEDTTRDASEILTATESLTLDGADVSLPQNRTEVDVRDGKVMVTYRTQEAEAETYERATRAAAAHHAHGHVRRGAAAHRRGG